jgi:hypothetical protein
MFDVGCSMFLPLPPFTVYCSLLPLFTDPAPLSSSPPPRFGAPRRSVFAKTGPLPQPRRRRTKPPQPRFPIPLPNRPGPVEPLVSIAVFHPCRGLCLNPCLFFCFDNESESWSSILIVILVLIVVFLSASTLLRQAASARQTRIMIRITTRSLNPRLPSLS